MFVPLQVLSPRVRLTASARDVLVGRRVRTAAKALDLANWRFLSACEQFGYRRLYFTRAYKELLIEAYLLGIRLGEGEVKSGVLNISKIFESHNERKTFPRFWHPGVHYTRDMPSVDLSMEREDAAFDVPSPPSSAEESSDPELVVDCVSSETGLVIESVRSLSDTVERHGSNSSSDPAPVREQLERSGRGVAVGSFSSSSIHGDSSEESGSLSDATGPAPMTPAGTTPSVTREGLRLAETSSEAGPSARSTSQTNGAGASAVPGTLSSREAEVPREGLERQAPAHSRALPGSRTGVPQAGRLGLPALTPRPRSAELDGRRSGGTGLARATPPGLLPRPNLPRPTVSRPRWLQPSEGGGMSVAACNVAHASSRIAATWVSAQVPGASAPPFFLSGHGALVPGVDIPCRNCQFELCMRQVYAGYPGYACEWARRHVRSQPSWLSR